MILMATGKRKIADSYKTTGNKAWEELFETTKRQLRQLQLGGAEKILSGMALGFDQLVVKAALEIGLPFDACLPFRRQSKTWPPSARSEYFELLKKAAQIIIVSEGEYNSWKLHKRNHYMVDNSDMVLAYLPPEFTSGGTYSCIQYAKSLNRPILNLGDLVQ